MATRFKLWWWRMEARWRLIRNHGDELNRRVEVEQVLFNMAAGKRPLPTQDECRALAIKLGTPTFKPKNQ